MGKAGKKKPPKVYISIKKSEMAMVLMMLIVKLQEEDNP